MRIIERPMTYTAPCPEQSRHWSDPSAPKSTRYQGAHEGCNCAEKGKSLLAGTVTLDLRMRIAFCLVVKTEYDFDKWKKGKVAPGKGKDTWKEQR